MEHNANGSGAARSVCPKCSGTGIVEVFPSYTGITDNQFQGCNHFNYAGSTTAPVNGFPKSYGMTKKEKAIEIIKQGGGCEGFACGSGGDNLCPCWDSCTGNGFDGSEKRVEICKAFLDDVVKAPDKHEPVESAEPAAPPEKTLLDEFAMAAMSGTCANSEYEKLRQALDGIVSEEKQTSALVSVCYDYAAAMMKERNRRDEMGNVKEATE